MSDPPRAASSAPSSASAIPSQGDDPPSARAKPLPRRLPELLEPSDPSTVSDLPLVPARMINEVLYCERLMYLEWVQGEWADNAFTVDGKSVHRRVNARMRPHERIPSTPSRTSDGLIEATAKPAWLQARAYAFG